MTVPPLITTNIQRQLEFVVGEVGRLIVCFSKDGQITQPTKPTLLVKPPNSDTSVIDAGAVLPYDDNDLADWGMAGLIPSPGYYSDVQFDTPGMWNWRFESTEGVVAVAQGQQWVNESNVS